MEKSIWENMNFITNTAVSVDGFVFIQYKYFKAYNEYLKLIPMELPHTEDESINLDLNLSKPFKEFMIYGNILEILACTTIESIVNSAGIHVMTEKFYKSTLERNDIVNKIKILVYMTKNEEIDEKTETLKKIKTIFERRNSLVHPKSKKVNWDNIEELKEYAVDKLDVDNSHIIELLNDFDDVLKFLLEYDLVSKHIFKTYDEEKYNI